ncbi:pyridoxamine 5'-phosphate oxidase family protein [Enterococcus sp. LJL99]
MRRKEREIIEKETLKAIVDSAHIVHLGLFDESYPYVVPVNYGYEWTENEQLILYIHGARQGKKVSLIKKNPNVCIQLDTNHALIETGKIAEKYSFAYQSIIGYGTATFIDEFEEKIHALERLMIHETKKDLTHFNPLPENVVKGTGIIKIMIDSLTGKEHLTE